MAIHTLNSELSDIILAKQSDVDLIEREFGIKIDR